MKFVHGFGVNDSPSPVYRMVDGKIVLNADYVAWQSMLRRCYSDKLHAKYPTYTNVSVCDEWRSFMSFSAWWQVNHVDGFELDKDIIGGGVEYSPESCIYIPQWLNKFTNTNSKMRGALPIGCRHDKNTGKYQARCCHPKTGKRIHLGIFNSPHDAHEAWKSKKLEIAEELKPRMDEIDLRIYPRVIEIISRAK